MNKEEARFILTAVRADRIDREDPRVAEAMRRVETDPELRLWFAEQSRFDREVSRKLSEVAPPADLRDSILAGVRASEPAPWNRRIVFSLAVAAALAVGLFLSPAFWLPTGTPPAPSLQTVAEFQEDMLREIEKLESLDHRSSDPREILSWLEGQGLENPASLAFLEEPGGHRFVGCKIFEWHGHQVSLICLGEEENGLPDLHLVTVSADAVEGELWKRPSLEKGESGNPWSTVAWRDGEVVHLIVAAGDRSDLRRLVPLG